MKTIELPRRLAAATGLGSYARDIADTDSAEAPAGPPQRSTQSGEALAALQFARLIGASPRLLLAPRGDGSVVIDVPGWRAPEASNAPLRAYLRALGWNARGWGLGTNVGDPRVNGRQLAREVAETVEREGRPVALVGWSLGGVISREIARNLPEAVRRVITFGSPVVGGPTHTITASAFGKEETRRAAQVSEQLDADNPIHVPITAIYTRRDGVVS